MGPGFQAQVAIMVAILVGVWVVKVVSVALYMICTRRRLDRLQQQHTQNAPTSCKPTPHDVITALPVMPYAKLLKQQRHESLATALPSSTSAAVATHQQQTDDQPNTADQQQPQQQFVSTLQAAMFAGCLNSIPDLQQQQQQPASRQVMVNIPGLASVIRSRSQQSLSQQSLSRSGSASALSKVSIHTSSSAGDLASRQQSIQSSDRDCCPICFNDYEASSLVKQLPCRHYYHSECIDLWLARDNTCPLCKRPVCIPASSSKQSAMAAPAADSGTATEDVSTALPAAVSAAAVEQQYAEQQQQQLLLLQGVPQQELLQVVVIRDG